MSFEKINGSSIGLSIDLAIIGSDIVLTAGNEEGTQQATTKIAVGDIPFDNNGMIYIEINTPFYFSIGRNITPTSNMQSTHLVDFPLEYGYISDTKKYAIRSAIITSLVESVNTVATVDKNTISISRSIAAGSYIVSDNMVNKKIQVTAKNIVIFGLYSVSSTPTYTDCNGVYSEDNYLIFQITPTTSWNTQSLSVQYIDSNICVLPTFYTNYCYLGFGFTENTVFTIEVLD